MESQGLVLITMLNNELCRLIIVRKMRPWKRFHPISEEVAVCGRVVRAFLKGENPTDFCDISYRKAMTVVMIRPVALISLWHMRSYEVIDLP